MLQAKDLTYVNVGRIEDFPIQMGRTVVIGDAEVAVFRTSADQLYALENRTPHKKGGPLTEGIVSSHYVYCPLRDLKINLQDGLVQAPDTGEVRTYPVRIEQGMVLIGLR